MIDSKTTIPFIGETKAAFYSVSLEVAELFTEFMKQFKTLEGRIVDDEQWPQFYATLTDEQKRSIVLLREIGIRHNSFLNQN